MFQKHYQRLSLWKIDSFFIFIHQTISMLYMIIEKFHAGKVKMIYERVEEKGRLMPEDVRYVNSWITTDMKVCYQVMESSSENKIHDWISNWNDLSDFEIIPVISSDEAKGITLSGN